MVGSSPRPSPPKCGLLDGSIAFKKHRAARTLSPSDRVGSFAIDILFYPAHRGSAMHPRPVSIALVAVTLTIAPEAAISEVYKWVETDGSVH